MFSEFSKNFPCWWNSTVTRLENPKNWGKYEKVRNLWKKPKIVIPTEPPSEFEFCHDPPTLNALELDIVKLTAQFVARNGRSFLTQLMQKEAKNYQFDFLRPQHTLFQHFSKLVEQYNKVLIPSKQMRSKVSGDLSFLVLIGQVYDELKPFKIWT